MEVVRTVGVDRWPDVLVKITRCFHSRVLATVHAPSESSPCSSLSKQFERLLVLFKACYEVAQIFSVFEPLLGVDPSHVGAGVALRFLVGHQL